MRQRPPRRGKLCERRPLTHVIRCAGLLVEVKPELFYVDLEQGVRVIVAPVPVVLLIFVFEFDKLGRLAVVLFGIDTIRLVFLAVPGMVVIVLFVVIGAGGLLILGSRHSRRHGDWGHKDGSQQGGTPETGHGCFGSPIRR